MNSCRTCRFWVQYPGDDDVSGECGMVDEHETRVSVQPMTYRNGGFCYHEQSSEPKLSAILITPPDFGCYEWSPDST